MRFLSVLSAIALTVCVGCRMPANATPHTLCINHVLYIVGPGTYINTEQAC